MLNVKKINKGFFVASVVCFIFLCGLVNTGMDAWAQVQRKNEIKQEENFNRPQPSQPVKPLVPDVNRYQEDKVFLEYADSLYKLRTNDTIERQILKGDVKFRQAGLWMFCDSAYYYPEANSLDAFSNVRMEQGDTLFVYADQLYYDGNLHLAKLRNGPTRDKVTLINKDVTLTTDSLDYDMNLDEGWYLKWGTIDDKVNVLTSLEGRYFLNTKDAEFFRDVVLENNKDGFTMLTDTLYYNTHTHIADIYSRTIIQSENDTIITTNAKYYTDTGDADLLTRSMIIHRDSTGNITTLEGDSIIYDSKTRISRAYMFRDPFKHSAPMVITDTAQKTTLIGGFGIYNDSTKEALATIYPLLMEYSQGDTLFLRADTIKTFIITEMIPDKRRKTKSGYPEYNGLPIVMSDSTGIWIDSTFFTVRIPYVETPLQMLLKVAPPAKKQEESITDSTESNQPEEIQDIEILDENLDYNQLNNTIINNVDSIINTGLSVDSLSYSEINFEALGDTAKFEPDKESNPLDTISLDDTLKPDSIPYEFHVALAYHRGRFFKQDMQGIADSIVFVERDSMLYMFRKPIVWSGERQVTGNRIDVHFNDSTADWAYLPEYGLISEHIDEDFYNQIYGKEITAYFENQGLRRMKVDGNVETIFLPQESDSTYNRLVNAESSYLEAYLDSNKLDWMKMWPEVSGTVTPIFLVKRNQMYLQKFKWWSFLRPEREWYGDRLHWADNLGEVPDELEQYFLAPSDFGEPKSFSGTRVAIPTSSLPTSFPDTIPPEEIDVAIEHVENTETLEEILDTEKETQEEEEETEQMAKDIILKEEEVTGE